MNHPDNILSWSDFMKVEMRVGTIITAEHFREARNPSYKLTIDFGEKGILKSSAQITRLYTPEELVGRQVVAVVNFQPKQIANMKSECLVLGSIGEDAGEITLLSPEKKVKNGLRIG